MQQFTLQELSMPEMRFLVRWPDATETLCYSPSLIIHEYFAPGQEYSVTDFVARSRTALNIANDRVFAKYGFECTSAKAQLSEIERIAAGHSPDESVKILRFQDK
jgi:uncharacterized repeat protein (TIGR04042 family)